MDDEGQSGLISCRLTTTQPSVTAELVFTERAIADRIISQYNNLYADGRYLKLDYQKQERAPPPKPALSPRHEAEPYHEDADMMGVEEVASTQATAGGATENSRYDSDREAAAASRDRRERESRRGDDPRDDPRSHDGPRREDERGPERPREQERERERGHDRRYDDRGGYDRRYDERPRFQDRGPSYRGGGSGSSARGYGGGVRGGYARAAGLNGDGRGGGGGYQDNYR